MYKLYTRDLRRLRATLGDFRRLWAILGPRVGLRLNALLLLFIHKDIALDYEYY